MGKVAFEINETSFSKKNTQQYELSILSGMDSLCYYIADAQRNLLVLRRFIPDPGEPIFNAFDSDPLLQRSFARVKIGLAHHRACLVPNRLYRESAKESYISGLVDLSPEDSIMTDELSLVDSMVVYAQDPADLAPIMARYPAASFYHLLTPLLKAYAQVAERYAGHQFFVNCRQHSLQIALFNQGDLLFYNTFEYQTASDFVYYVLLVCKQFDLDPDKMDLYYSGWMVEDSKIYHLLFRYVRNVQPLPPVDLLYQGAQARQQLAFNQYVDLFSLALCK